MAAFTRDARSPHSPDSLRPPRFVTPVITEQDLVAFHNAHFPGCAKPATFFIDPAAEFSIRPEEQEDDDGLGYYPDGVKRTLTDAQIEMFRHSERMQIERAERLRQEEVADRSANLPQPAQVVAKPEDSVELQHSQASSETGRAFTAELTRSTTSKSSRSDREEVPYQQRNKRKWEGYISTEDPRHGSMTHRRMARELDEQQADSIDIDYG